VPPPAIEFVAPVPAFVRILQITSAGTPAASPAGPLTPRGGQRIDRIAYGGSARGTLVSSVRTIAAVSDAGGWDWTGQTHKRQLRDNNTQDCKKVDDEIGQVVVGIMRAQEEQDNGDT